jgi:hypothetical protein
MFKVKAQSSSLDKLGMTSSSLPFEALRSPQALEESGLRAKGLSEVEESKRKAQNYKSFYIF